MSLETKAAPDQRAQDESHADWAKILVDAVQNPGVISKAYSHFWNYSVGNQVLAWFQCMERNLEPGPIHTFQGWKDVGRYVKKGEKALTLCMPVVVKRKVDDAKPDAETIAGGDGAERSPDSFTRFVYKPH